MTISRNTHDRSYATCDGHDCDDNVIDLPLDRDACERILSCFFQWTARPGGHHHCLNCSGKKSRRRRPVRWDRMENSNV